MDKKLFAIITASVLVLTACLVPEKFTASITFQPSGDYAFQYSGTAVNPKAAAEIKQAGLLSNKSNKELIADAVQMKKYPAVQQADYKGNGRYQITLQESKKMGQTLNAFDIFSVSKDKFGVITIASLHMDAHVLADLSKLGLVIDGTLDVTLPKNAVVISSNATSQPSFFGLLGKYSWKIGAIDQRPMMKIKLQ
jgi:hypothetical protein